METLSYNLIPLPFNKGNLCRHLLKKYTNTHHCTANLYENRFSIIYTTSITESVFEYATTVLLKYNFVFYSIIKGLLGFL